MSIYPNPVQDKINFRTGKDVETMSVRLFSALGSVAFQMDSTDVSPFEVVTYDVSELPPGLYTAVVVLDGVEYKQQVVKL